MAKRQTVRLHEMQKHDEVNRDETVRELEMIADGAITSSGYPVQFWQDVQLYGVDEAILYVRNGKHGNADIISKAWEEIRLRILKPLPIHE